MKSLVFYTPEQERSQAAYVAMLLDNGMQAPAMVDGRFTEAHGRNGILRYEDTVIRPTPPAERARVDKMIEEANANV